MVANSPFFIRMATPADVAACRKIDIEAWGEESAASEEMLLSRIATYPCGNFVAIDRGTGGIVGSVWSVALPDKKITTWAESSGDGLYGSVCDPHGPMIQGVNLSMRRDYNGLKVGRLLVEQAGGMIFVLGKQITMLGARIPEYSQWQHVFNAEDYIHMKKTSVGCLYFTDTESGLCHEGPRTAVVHAAGIKVDPRDWPVVAQAPVNSEALDGELGYFLDMRQGGTLPQVRRALPNYFIDPDSCDYAALVVWENPDYIGPRCNP